MTKTKVKVNAKSKAKATAKPTKSRVGKAGADLQKSVK